MRGFVFIEDRYGHVARKLQTTQGRTYVLRYLHTDPLGRLPGETVPLQNPPPGNQMIGMTYPDGSGCGSCAMRRRGRWNCGCC